MATPASASGSASEAIIPVKAQSNGPSHFSTRQPGTHTTPAGTLSSGQTMESSTGVRVTEANWPSRAHSGVSAFGSSFDMAYRPGRTVKVKRALGLISSNPFLHIRRTMVRQKAIEADGVVKHISLPPRLRVKGGFAAFLDRAATPPL